MERNDIILQWELQNSFLSLTGLSTLILGIILIRQIINGRNGFETVMACLILWFGLHPNSDSIRKSNHQ